MIPKFNSIKIENLNAYNYNKIPKAMSTFRYKGFFDGLNTYWANNKKKLNCYKNLYKHKFNRKCKATNYN